MSASGELEGRHAARGNAFADEAGFASARSARRQDAGAVLAAIAVGAVAGGAARVIDLAAASFAKAAEAANGNRVSADTRCRIGIRIVCSLYRAEWGAARPCATSRTGNVHFCRARRRLPSVDQPCGPRLDSAWTKISHPVAAAIAPISAIDLGGTRVTRRIAEAACEVDAGVVGDLLICVLAWISRSGAAGTSLCDGAGSRPRWRRGVGPVAARLVDLGFAPRVLARLYYLTARVRRARSREPILRRPVRRMVRRTRACVRLGAASTGCALAPERSWRRARRLCHDGFTDGESFYAPGDQRIAIDDGDMSPGQTSDNSRPMVCTQLSRASAVCGPEPGGGDQQQHHPDADRNQRRSVDPEVGCVNQRLVQVGGVASEKYGLMPPAAAASVAFPALAPSDARMRGRIRQWPCRTR